jgi:hypothetical protein
MSLEHALERQSRRAARTKAKRGPALEALWTTEELAAFLSVTPEVLRAARTEGTGAFGSIPWLKLGRLVRYDPRAVSAWLARHERENAA